MIDLTLQAFGLFAALVIFWRAEPILNIMAPSCRLLVRLAFWLLAVGAAGLATCIVFREYVPPAAFVSIVAGVALLLMSERRVRALLRLHSPVTRNRRAAV